MTRDEYLDYLNKPVLRVGALVRIRGKKWMGTYLVEYLSDNRALAKISGVSRDRRSLWYVAFELEPIE